jgi:hypothetical protein
MAMLLRDAIHTANTCTVEVFLAPEPDDFVRCELQGIEREQGVLVVLNLKGRGTNDTGVQEHWA